MRINMKINAISKKIISYLPELFLVFLGMFFFSPTSKICNSFYYAIIIPATIFALLNIDFQPLKKQPIIYITLLYFLYAICSVLWSENLTAHSMIKIIKHSFYVITFGLFIYATLQKHGWKFKKILYYATILASFSAFVSICYWYGYKGNSFHERLVGCFRNYNTAASNLAYGSCFLFVLYNIIYTRRNLLINVLISLPLFAFIVLTQSRSTAGIMFLFSIIFVMYYYRKNIKLFIVSTSIVCFVALLYYHTILNWRYESINQEMMTIEQTNSELKQNELSRYCPFRPYIWKFFFQKVLERPIFGHGFSAKNKFIIQEDNLQRPFEHPHSLYLSQLYYGGIVAFCIFVIMICMFFYIVMQHHCRPMVPILTIFILFTLLIYILDGDSLIKQPREFWFSFWMPYFSILSIVFLDIKYPEE
ncbi:MAG: O-antigen ligase family protein [Planctomycetes bacterium]|nr:O-antigen ligase family protein [Planctomycetota bacterium]HPY74218.1 O-antigen ligase family protein [Planctomycetota bacterium]HQB00047.1 O-antigen ligase family protein [Planctomycetota bacterium]